MRVIQFIILIVVLGWCFSSAGNAAYAMVQADNDSIIAPNVFTPNGDGHNDFFIVRSSNEQDVVVLNIYTRAGVLVFSIEAKLCVWDGSSLSGEPMANGVYFYTAEVRGSSSTIPKCGFVHLFR